MKQDKINSFGVCTIICALCSAPFYGIFSSYTLNKAKNSTIISLIIGYILSLIISTIILYYFKQKGNHSLVCILKTQFNKLSTLLIILFLLCSLTGYILLTYRLTTFLSNQYLVQTPKYFLSISIILLTYYISTKGIETLSRVSTISFYISTIIFLFDFFSLLPQINIQNYFPIITVSHKDILISALIFSFYFSIPIIHINIINTNNIEDNNHFNKYYYSMISLSFIIIFLSMCTAIGVSGININNLFDYPFYTILKRIKLFSFLDSIENVSIMLWIFYIINASSMMFFFIKESIKETFNLTNKKSNITNIILLIISFCIPNYIFLKNNYNESYNYIWIPFTFLGIMFLIIIFSLIKSKLDKT